MNKLIKHCLKNVGMAVIGITVTIGAALLTVLLSKAFTDDKAGRIIIAMLLTSVFIGIFVSILDFYSDR